MRIHASGGIEIHREDDGTIRVLHVVATFSEQAWCDFIAAMSARGACPEQIERVRELHCASGEPEP